MEFTKMYKIVNFKIPYVLRFQIVNKDYVFFRNNSDVMFVVSDWFSFSLKITYVEDNLLNYLAIVVLYRIIATRLYLIHSKEIRIELWFDVFCNLLLVVSDKVYNNPSWFPD